MITKPHRYFTFTLLSVFAIFLPVWAAPDAKPKPTPKWMAGVTKSAPGIYQRVNPCELHYRLSWNGLVKAGEAQLKIGMKDPASSKRLLGTLVGESSGLAKRLWFYKNQFQSHVDAKSLRPVFFQATETEKKEKIITKASFANGIVTSTETVQKRSGGKPKTKQRIFAYNHAHDMLSAVLYLRSHPLKKGDQITMVVHPFKSAYLTKFRVLGRETFKTPLGKQKAIKLDIKLYKIDRDLELKSYKKFKRATIWISDDVYRMPLEVRSEVFIGNVRATLEKRQLLRTSS